jgi:2-phosphoglycolate phosphatase
MDENPGVVKAVLFDFDGTLADSYDGIAASVNHVRASHGLPPLSTPEVRRHVGRGVAYLLAHTVAVGDPQRNDALYRDHHPSVMKTGTRLMDGAADALAVLHGRGLRLAVCSNKPVRFTRELLEALGIASLFEAVLGPEDVAQPKPAPDMLLAGLRRLGVGAGEALYVGDMTVDIATARAAGVPVWVVPTGSDEAATLRAAAPDRLLASLAELPALLAK